MTCQHDECLKNPEVIFKFHLILIMSMASLVSTFLALLMFCTTYVESNLDGWKMTDRFNGFRFEIMDSHVPDGMKEKIQGEFQRTN